MPLVHIILTFLWQLESPFTKAETEFTQFKEHVQGQGASKGRAEIDARQTGSRAHALLLATIY